MDFTIKSSIDDPLIAAIAAAITATSSSSSSFSWTARAASTMFLLTGSLLGESFFYSPPRLLSRRLVKRTI